MSLRLKEDPKEWMKFTGASIVALSVLTVLLRKRHIISQAAMTSILMSLIAALCICLFRPRWFRLFYRVGMIAGFRVGQVVGIILLTVVFWCVLTPLGALLRLCGKDLLMIKKGPTSETYWRTAKSSADFDR